MRSRTALIALLSIGALLTGAGGALGASALSTRTDSTSAQYGAPVPTSQVLGQPPVSGTTPAATTPAATTPAATTPTAAPQAPRQVTAGAQSSLPFTGYAAIPLLLLGLGLLAGGMLLRRATARSDSRD